jgi:recA bacterial DNA recombination protein
MPNALKIALEDLLRSRKLQEDGPPLRGIDRRQSPLATGIAALDEMLGGGFPRGQVSEVHGPASSGRTGTALALVARATASGTLAAWVDPGDRLDPASAAESGIALDRLLWLRGEPHAPPGRAVLRAVSAVSTLVGSGLFDLVVLDLASVPAAELRRLPGPTWLRLQRLLEDAPAALVLVADAHVASGPRGVSLVLAAQGPRWAGEAGPGRLLQGLSCEARGARALHRAAGFDLHAGS